MENCYQIYTWLCRTIVALMLQMFWKMRQISDYFSQEQSEENSKLSPLASELSPLTKEYKLRRHIRSMSDVQSSKPWHHSTAAAARRYSQQALHVPDARSSRLRTRSRYRLDSSDSSGSRERLKPQTVEGSLKRYATSTDSMRYL